MTDSYHFNPNFDHIAYMERQERARLNQLFDSFYAKQAKLLNPLAGIGDVTKQSIGPLPSGATLKVAGDKIVGRVEAGPATYDVSVGNCLLTAGESHSAIRAVIDSFRAQDTIPEPIRPALDWNTATPFEPFADFIVTKGAEPTSPLYDSPTTDSAYPAIAGLLRG